MMKKIKKTVIVLSILFVLYNFMVLFIAGIGGHSAVFWSSYIIGNISLITVTIILCLLMKNGASRKIFFLSYPIMMWSAIYLIVQIIISIIFMCIDDFIKVSVSIHLLLFVIYIIIVVACAQTKDIIENVQGERAADIEKMKYMISQMKIISSRVTDDSLKLPLQKLSDEFKYSDIVSSKETLFLEQQLINEIDELKVKCINDPKEAITLINQISDHLAERNIICQRSKKRY